MRKFAIAVAMLAVLLAQASTQAQDKPAVKVSLASRGGPASGVLDSMAQTLGYTLRYSPDLDVEQDLSFHVWLRVKDATPERAARLLSFALGNTVRLDAARKEIYVAAGEEPGPRGSVLKGYDVSVACARFVAYQNQWGQPRQRPAPQPLPRNNEGASDQPAQPAVPAQEASQRTAADHLADLIEYVLGEGFESGPSPAVVGDRLLLRDSARAHARVRELLDLLVADAGGASGAARDEQTVLDALRKAKPPLALDETPLASVLAQLCDAAESDFAVRGTAVDWLEEDHVSLAFEPEVTVEGALHAAFNDNSLRWVISDGAVLVGQDDFAPAGYRVFETADLLKKIDSGIQRQRTDPDRRQGFTGDLRSLGGVDVVVNALLKVLEEDSPYTHVESWGSRVIVRGNCATLALAETALKEMGWEAPKGN